MHRHELEDLAARFLAGLSTRHVLRRLAFLDDPGNALEEPRLEARRVGAGTELLDEHDHLALRVDGEHGGDVPALEHLAGELRSEPAAVLAMAQPIAVDAPVALEDRGLLDDLDVDAHAYRPRDAPREQARASCLMVNPPHDPAGLERASILPAGGIAIVFK